MKTNSNHRSARGPTLAFAIVAAWASLSQCTLAQSTFPDSVSGKALRAATPTRNLPVLGTGIANRKLGISGMHTSTSGIVTVPLMLSTRYWRSYTLVTVAGIGNATGQEQNRSQRGLYAAVGFFTGAVAGWVYGDHICRRDNCMIPVSNVMMAAAGGALGALAGLLIAP